MSGEKSKREKERVREGKREGKRVVQGSINTREK